MDNSALEADLKPKYLPGQVVQFYDGRRGFNTSSQRVVMKSPGNMVFVLRIRVWFRGRWRGEILVWGNKLSDLDLDSQTRLTTEAKHYKFINYEAMKSWFRSEWLEDWYKDFHELTRGVYRDEG